MSRIHRVGLLPGSRAHLSDIDDVTISVLVVILTYHRTEALPRAVDALLEACRHYPSAAILVVDNNPSGDAGPTVAELARHTRRGALRYVHEPQPGIAAARNRALRESGDARLLVFVDDDERPTERWLDQLTRLFRERQPAAIAGPVVSEFAHAVDPWITAGRFFVRRRLPTGSAVGWAATNNLLLDMAQIRRLGLTFDDEFGLTGGSDTLFTRQLVRAGGTILWCDEAVVIDHVPASRLTRQWVLQKAFRLGNVTPRIEAALVGSMLARLLVRAKYAVSGTARIGLGISRLAFGLVTRQIGHRARGVRLTVRGAGIVLGAFGYRYVEYSRTQRSAGSPAASAPHRPDVAERDPL